MAFNLGRFLVVLSRELEKAPVTAGMRRSLILRTFQRMATSKMPLPSGANLIAQLRAKGLSIRTQDFYRMYSSFKRLGPFAVEQRLRPPTKRPLKADVPVWPGFVSRRYLYSFTMNVYDYKQEIWRDKSFRMTGERLYSPASAERRFRDWWSESGFSTEVDLNSVRYETVWKSKFA